MKRKLKTKNHDPLSYQGLALDLARTLASSYIPVSFTFEDLASAVALEVEEEMKAADQKIYGITRN